MKKAGTGLLVAGWIFSVLGGWIGLFISSHIVFNKTVNETGEKVPTYDETSRTQGKVMLAVVLCVIGLGLILSAAA